MTPEVTVIIAAKDASATIARAIRSALAEPEVAQVIVVDDGSSDDTAAVARGAGAGDGRLLVERLPANRGPSAARNHALGLVTADLVAILDADDILLPGRFARLLAVPDWDMIADNILFVADGTDLDTLAVPQPPPRPRSIDLDAFIDGCVTRSRTRSQLGFLKPVIRRAVLERHGLRYDEGVRLGEDFLLYVELLRRGARFVLVDAVGYVAVERGTSLSARHGTDDLAALLAAERALLRDLPPESAAARTMRRRIAETAGKYALRAFLRTRREQGAVAAIRWLCARPDAWIAVVGGIARDKVQDARRHRGASEPAAPRLLLGPPDPPA
jgi:succinoglycan biosynthesis protein ExoU